MSAKIRLATLLSAAALGASACGTITDASTTDPNEPRRGGTLRLVGSGDVVNLDTASAYYVPTWMLLRTVSRQLVSYPYTDDQVAATTPVPDLAESMPAITADQLTYTFTIRDGAEWDVGEAGRQITAEDMIRGMERLCNPVSPSGALGYYTGTIAGMEDYCSAWAEDVQNQDKDFEVTTDYIKNWLAANDISGIRAVDDRTVEFTLIEPASDFLNIMAMTFASPVPEEMLEYLPDSPEYRENFISSGPYKFERYIPNQSIYLVRNPNWDSGSDDLREAYVNRIEIVMGSDQGPVQRQIEAGTADLAWDVSVPGPDVVKHLKLESPQLTQWPTGEIWYLVFNLYRKNSALQDVRVRQAIGYAIDRANIARILGGPPLVESWGQVLTPPVIHQDAFERYDAFAAESREEAVARAQALLAEAGHPGGFGIEPLTLPYRNADVHPEIAQSITTDLEKVGISVDDDSTTPNDFYGEYLFDADGAKQGEWDIAVAGWVPDWYGNAGRSFLVPLLDGRYCGNNSTNYGCYDDEKVTDLIQQALTAGDDVKAGQLWMQADHEAMADAPWVPLATRLRARFHSERVGGFVVSLGSGPDLTNIWLTHD